MQDRHRRRAAYAPAPGQPQAGDWITIGSQTIAMANPQIGVAYNSESSSTLLATAKVDNVLTERLAIVSMRPAHFYVYNRPWSANQETCAGG